MDLRTPDGRHGWALLKLGEKKFLEKFRVGQLYMKPLAGFSEGADSERNDCYEGTTSLIQPSNIGDLFIESNIPGFERIVIPPGDLAGPVQIAKNQAAACNIFCMFAVTEPVDGPIFDKRHQKFGGSVVLVTDIGKFLARTSHHSKR
jgi:hypothetical protein